MESTDKNNGGISTTTVCKKDEIKNCQHSKEISQKNTEKELSYARIYNIRI